MCGIFSAWGIEDASNHVYLGLYALQHRGQESFGIVSTDGEQFYMKKKMCLVADAFHPTTLKMLRGRGAIGHVRYSTSGPSVMRNMQPIHAQLHDGEVALAHNGNLVNAPTLRRQLHQEGMIFQSSLDTELIFHLMARSQATSLKERFFESLTQVRGAYSLVMMTHNQLLLARDPYGYRPLILGEYRDGLVAGSETCAFDLIGAKFVRELEPGEVVCVDQQGKTTSDFLPRVARQAYCVFEHVYLARPDSHVFGENVYSARKAMGRRLAQEHPVTADVVVPVPDSGVPAALGYSEECKIPFDFGLIRNHYVHRTFIEPDQRIRNFGVRVKLNLQRTILKNKSVVVVDDSIVRGTTSRKIIGMLREAGARSVHMRVSSPAITHPCHFGIDTPTRQELIGANKSVEEIRGYLNVDSLGYLSQEGMLSVLAQTKDSYCVGCFSGRYPEAVDVELTNPS